jgi:cation diffusion facilitator CzcD-associated flavoprotein CzcO
MIHTNARVITARWTGTQWLLEFADGATHAADILVPAIGQLNVPAIPPITGLDRFAGKHFHTARWRHDIDLTGLRVTVVGTGASAIQVIPEIAPRVGHLTVVQRSAPYVLRKFDTTYTERLHRLYRSLPLLRSAARQMIWGYLELVTVGFTRWPHALAVLQRYHDRILRTQIADPALRRKLRPDYPIGCKRILMSNDYYAALTRPNVTVLSESLTGVTEFGVTTTSGHHHADVIVLATGFTSTPLFSGIEIIGCDGTRLQQVWAERERAYLGLSVPRFPNMFLMYGPNTNLGSGSIVYMLEAQVAHIVAAANVVRAQHNRALEISDRAFHAFGEELDAAQPRTVWSGCSSWYHDAAGRDTHNWPWTMSQYRRRTRRINRADYELLDISSPT